MKKFSPFSFCLSSLGFPDSSLSPSSPPPLSDEDDNEDNLNDDHDNDRDDHDNDCDDHDNERDDHDNEHDDDDGRGHNSS